MAHSDYLVVFWAVASIVSTSQLPSSLSLSCFTSLVSSENTCDCVLWFYLIITLKILGKRILTHYGRFWRWSDFANDIIVQIMIHIILSFAWRCWYSFAFYREGLKYFSIAGCTARWWFYGNISTFYNIFIPIDSFVFLFVSL